MIPEVAIALIHYNSTICPLYVLYSSEGTVVLAERNIIAAVIHLLHWRMA